LANSEKTQPGRLPEFVYHYTSVDTMLKIVKDCCVWATSINYLNDTTEGDHYLGLIRERIRDSVFSHKYSDPRIFDSIMSESKNSFEDRPYVTSFSELGDYLPQWRSYCPQGNGVAIGFDTDCLLRSQVKDTALEQDTPHPEKSRFEFFRPKVRFAKIDYVDKTAKELLDQDISAAIEEANAQAAISTGMNLDHPGERDGGPRAPSRLFESAIRRRAGFIKNPSFSNESEYRLLVESSVWNRRLLEFRATRSTLVPYLPVAVPRFHSKPKPWPQQTKDAAFIGRVVIGPTPDTEIARQAILAFLYKEGLNYVDVKTSEIPYRDR
jgi:Protein of unknown function (DUF2971)